MRKAIGIAIFIAGIILHPTAQAAPGCPKGLEDWKAWRDRSITQLLQPRINDKGERLIDPAQVMASSVQIANFIDDCAPSFSPQPTLIAQIGNLATFTQALRNNLSVFGYDHQFGYTIDDFDYLSRVQDNVELPELLKSQEFLKKISNKATYRDALKMIDDQNASLPSERQWTTFMYKSRFLTTPDEASTFGRFFILVPGDKYQKWIQFGIKLPDDDKNLTPINNLSIVSVANPDAQGRRFNAIIDWWRIYNSDGSITLETRRKSQGVTENCAMCHKTSPLGIHPAEEYVFDSNGKLIPNTTNPGMIPAKLNALILEYGAPYFNGWMDPMSYGPPLGEDRQRTDAFMQTCSSGLGLDAAAIARVKRNMTCTDCHSESGAGAVGVLNYPETTRLPKNSRNQIYQCLSLGWMPPKKQLPPADLKALTKAKPSERASLYQLMIPHQIDMIAEVNTNEREALYSCLMKEYFDVDAMTGSFISWLKTNGPVIGYSDPMPLKFNKSNAPRPSTKE